MWVITKKLQEGRKTWKGYLTTMYRLWIKIKRLLNGIKRYVWAEPYRRFIAKTGRKDYA